MQRPDDQNPGPLPEEVLKTIREFQATGAITPTRRAPKPVLSLYEHSMEQEAGTGRNPLESIGEKGYQKYVMVIKLTVMQGKDPRQVVSDRLADSYSMPAFEIVGLTEV